MAGLLLDSNLFQFLDSNVFQNMGQIQCISVLAHFWLLLDLRKRKPKFVFLFKGCHHT